MPSPDAAYSVSKQMCSGGGSCFFIVERHV